MGARLARHTRTPLCWVAVFVFVLVGASAASAAPFTVQEFGDKVDRAISVVRDAGSDVASAPVAAQVAMDVESLLPLGLEVREGTRTVTVADNATVHVLTRRLREASFPQERMQLAEQLESHLASMRTAVGTPGDAPWDDAALDKLLAARPATPGAGEDWVDEQLARLLESFARWLDGIFGSQEGSGNADVSRLLQYVVVAIPIIAVIWILVVTVRGRRRRRTAALAPLDGVAQGPVVAAAADLPSDPLEYALLLARDQQYRDAVRALYGGAARHLVEQGLVARMRTRTNREMLRDVRAAAPLLEEPFARLTDAFEQAWYGHADPGSRGFEAARATYEVLLRSADAAADVAVERRMDAAAEAGDVS